MNKKILVLLVTTLVVAACSSSDDKNKGVVIPQDLSFTPQKGTPLSKEEVEAFKTTLKEFKTANENSIVLGLPDLLIGDSTDDQDDIDEKNKEIADLAPEQRAQYEEAKANCTVVNMEKAVTGGNLDRKGAKKSEKGSGSVSGANCPINAKVSESTAMEMVDLKSDSQGYPSAYKIQLSAEMANSTKVKKTAGLPAKTVVAMDVNAKVRGAIDMQMDSADSSSKGKSFSQFDFIINIKTADGGTLSVKGLGKMLMVLDGAGDTSSAKTVAHADVVMDGKLLKISAQLKMGADGKAGELEVYVNGGKVDLSDLGDIFPLSDISKSLKAL